MTDETRQLGMTAQNGVFVDEHIAVDTIDVGDITPADGGGEPLVRLVLCSGQMLRRHVVLDADVAVSVGRALIERGEATMSKPRLSVVRDPSVVEEVVSKARQTAELRSPA